ncbi:fumarylacetoacetate hydrolase family protein [Chitinophagaceae bacterium LB-8]|uniref:Fumarylacetoacetate hydrolase family protein n=1 Tax=Paraflavisolibacter caeni TaxID=2982496 RepID=A0A9X3BI80_9BACT|nr:fumarylacetoacetate hydrolase family protein [Paraflavisolibacter caeni]MCU7549758.1 fumarylacetoacetate hydrolase family protein [Paraflavisolibacter caeni]
MKLVTFKNKDGAERAGWLKGDGVVDMHLISKGALPANMLQFIDHHEQYFAIIKEQGLEDIESTYSLDAIKLLAPLPNPRSFRDYVSFEQHLQNAAARFGHSIAKEWYEMPIFYFTNHQAIYGPEEEIARPSKETKLDYELEMACIIGKKGKNIKAEEAEDYIFGYTVFNDWTARSIQGVEMKVHLGPAKGKDFANAIGPCIVTRDEMNQYLQDNGRFNVRMIAKINGQVICEGNFNTIHYTFGQMIERASENGVTLYPGDILGSGTVGWGSLIETGGEAHRFLERGDVVEFEIEGIGVLRNYVV